MPSRSEMLESIEQYNSNKHLEEFYKIYLSKIGKAVEPEEQLEIHVKHLFYWFLGKINTKSKKGLEAVEIGGITYYISRAAPSNVDSMQRAVRHKNLWAGLAFKNNNLPLENFLNYAGSITKSSIVLPAFYVHIFKPEEYPILNSNVWTAYRERLGKNVFINTKPSTWDNYMGYVSYCNYLKNSYGLTLRQIDKGLWVAGERLKTLARQTKQETPEKYKNQKFHLYDNDKSYL